MKFFELKKYLTAIRMNKASAIAEMDTDYERIFDYLKEKGLIENWPGVLEKVALSKTGNEILKDLERKDN